MSALDQQPQAHNGTESIAQAIESQSLSRVFNAYVAEVKQQVPEMRGHFAILNIAESRVHMDIDLQKSGFKDHAELMDYMSKLQATYAPHQTSVAHFDGKHNLGVLVYNGPKHMQMFADPVKDPLKNIVSIMDHEFGHMTVEGAYYYSNRHSPTEIIYAEGAADVYAGLRHISRFGGSGDDIRYLSWQRSKHLVENGHTSHFTSLSLDKLADLADAYDLSGLSAHQAIELSARIASETAPHAATLKEASRFLPHINPQDVQVKGYESALKPLGDKILHGDMDYMAAKIADRFLSPFLMEQVVFKGKPVLLDGPYWDKVRIALCDHNMAQEKLGVLQGMPARPKAPRT